MTRNHRCPTSKSMVPPCLRCYKSRDDYCIPSKCICSVMCSFSWTRAWSQNMTAWQHLVQHMQGKSELGRTDRHALSTPQWLTHMSLQVTAAGAPGFVEIICQVGNLAHCSLLHAPNLPTRYTVSRCQWCPQDEVKCP